MNGDTGARTSAGRGGVRFAPLVAVALLAGGLAAAPTAVAASSGAGPVLGKSIQISRVSGTVTVEPRGSKTFTLVTQRRTVPVGSTVNASSGTVGIVAATMTHRGRQTAHASGGAFTLTQVPRNPLVTMVLTARRPVKSVCGPSNAAAAKKKPTHGVLSTLHATDTGGGWRTATGTAAATVRGTEWTTQDTCAGTTFSVEKGVINTSTNKAPLSSALQPHQSLAYQCPSTGKCEELLGASTPVTVNGTAVQTPGFGASYVTKSNVDDYDLCVTGPSETGCTTYPLGSPSASGWRRSVVACVPPQAGTYQISWRVNGVLLGLPLTYVSPPIPAGVRTGCGSTPISRQGVPAGLNATQTSGDFVVHYDDASPSDPNYLTSAQAMSVAETAQNALRFETGTLGMPMYLDPAVYPGSTPGKIDIYASASTSLLSDTHTWPEVGETTFPGIGQPSSAYIVQSADFDPEAIGFSVFQVLLDGIGITGRDDAGLWGSMGTWAGANFDQSGSADAQISAPPLSEPIDCDMSCPGTVSQDQWRFYEHLAEKFGASIIPAILSADDALLRSDSSTGHMDAALEQVLSSHGSSLASELAEYAFEDDDNGWRETWIQKLPYIFDGNSYMTEPVAATSGTITPATVVVNHLASHVLELTVAPSGSSTCVLNTLTVDMTVPSGGLEPGTTLFSGGTHPGANADPTDPTPSDTATFDSCDGARLDLVFTNGTSADGMTFGATGTLVYDSGPLSSGSANRVVTRAAGPN
ncbi:MAG TPA: hypothetical protein VG223_14040 [Solirubrobacteraceae bacterium]|nr:hypothetical protein [Solirubrobacteraceae bacterium]